MNIGDGVVVNGATAKVKASFVPQQMFLIISVTIPAVAATLVTWIAKLKLLTIETKLQSNPKPLIANGCDVYRLALLAQDFRGLMRGSITKSGADAIITAKIPIVNSDGFIQQDFQVNIINNMGADVTYELTGLSEGIGRKLNVYTFNQYTSQNVFTIVSGWKKLLLGHSFERLNMIINGHEEEVTVNDAKAFGNLQEEVIAKVVEDDGTYAIDRILIAEDSGSIIFDASEGTFGNITLNLDGGLTPVNSIFMSERAV
jgi:hypothetical protein